MRESSSIPLSHKPLFRSTDLDEARDVVGNVFKPHRLEFLAGERRLHAVQNRVELGEVSLNYLTYGGDVFVGPGPLEDFYLIQMPLTGSMRVSLGSQTAETGQGAATVCSPHLPLSIEWMGDCASLTVQVPRMTLERFVGNCLGIRIRRPIEFDLAMDVSRGEAQSWRRILTMICDELARPASAARKGMLSRQFEDLLLATLVGSQRHNYSAMMKREAAGPSPYYVKRAEDYIHAHAGREITIEDLVTVSGVSARSLFAGFRAYRGQGPMAFLKQVRLERARAELAAADPGRARVIDIALKWHFSHMGRFAADYGRRFGEAPSVTLRRINR